MIAFASSLDQAGPMAKTAEDCALMLKIMAGYDAKDSTSANIITPDYTEKISRSINGLKIGVPKEYFQDGLNFETEKIKF